MTCKRCVVVIIVTVPGWVSSKKLSPRFPPSAVCCLVESFLRLDECKELPSGDEIQRFKRGLPCPTFLSYSQCFGTTVVSSSFSSWNWTWFAIWFAMFAFYWCHDIVAGQPTPLLTYPPRNKALIASLIKGKPTGFHKPLIMGVGLSSDDDISVGNSYELVNICKYSVRPVGILWAM